MSCGGSAKKKMAKGGMPTKVLGPAKKPFAAGIPFFTGAGQTGPEYMKKGGTMGKAKFGATTPVKASCKKGEVRSASGGCVSQRPKFQNGGSAKTMLSKAPAKMKSSLTSKDPMTVKNISKFIKGGKKYQYGGQNKPTVEDKSLFPGAELVGFLGAGAATALAARRQNNPQVQKKQQERIKAREDKKTANKKIDATAKKITSNVMRKGGSTKKYQNGGVTVTNQKISPNDPYERAQRVLSSKAAALDRMKKSQLDNYKKPKNTTKKEYQNGGATKSAAKPKPKYVYGDVPGIGGPAAGQAATPGETLMMDEKLAAERKAKAAAAKRKAQATKKGK